MIRSAVLGRVLGCVAATIALSVFVGATPAYASTSVWYGLTSASRPTSLTAGGAGQIVVTAQNLGYSDADGTTEPVVLEDTLPEGLTVRKNGKGEPELFAVAGHEGLGGPVVCSSGSPQQVRCVFEHSLSAFDRIEVVVGVEVAAGASAAEQNTVSVTGGGATGAKTISRHIDVGHVSGFGLSEFSVIPEEAGGGVSTQAGVHPFQLTTAMTFDTSEASADPIQQLPAALVKDLTIQTPPGLIGNPTPFVQCTDAQFNQSTPEGDACPPQAAVGVVNVVLTTPGTGLQQFVAPLFNLAPLPGEPARFGFVVGPFVTTLDPSIRTGSDYGVTIHVNNITETAGLLQSKVTFWGVPGDPRHDAQRGWDCIEHLSGCGGADSSEPPPLLSMPTSCDGPMVASVQADSWTEPKPAHPFEAGLFSEYDMGTQDGCNHLQFSPEIEVTPDSSEASKPTGLNVDVHVPQTAVLNGEGLAESNVKDIAVALPEGVAVNPAGGNGLAACSEGLAGFTGFAEPEHVAAFTPDLPEPFEPGVDFCPNASKIGELTVKSPLLPPGQFLKGFVYLATQNENPFGGLIGLYLVAKDPISGVVFKAAGETQLTPSGQLIGVFKNNPQLAFEDAELHFFGGERAPLSSPERCGAYTTNASFTPWSGDAPVTASSTFNVTSGPNGAPCPGATLPFAPTVASGTLDNSAGQFSQLTTTFTRGDGQQSFQSVIFKGTSGLSAMLSNIKLCPEAQANEGTCGPESLAAESTVLAGVGSDPVTVTGGKVYLTEGYRGAPFGLSIVNPVKAGPFDLERDTSNPSQDPACDCVVVRAKVEVDPVTAAITVTTDQSGPYAIPHLIDGVPVQIKTVNILINREHFTFNPTSCEPFAITGAINGEEGASSPVSVPFQVTNCAVLKFTPTLAVSTAGKASKADGTSLDFKIGYPKGAVGSQSWMKLMKFSIPKQLPSRLTTIQKACLAATFETNRAACPPASIIGHVLVHTPVLPVPLEGPLYFVSYGGAAFPDAVAVLHGYGLTIESHGHTFIDSKTGVTSATFESIPDVPFESIEVTLPQGPFSEFGANLPHSSYDFCGQKLVMPTVFKAQNGLEIHQNTPVGITGCPKGLTKAQKLAAALKACHRKHAKRRAACEKAARRKYGARVSKRGAKRT